jgi:RimJ/RimL family protein N-acetyltransferase
MTTKPNPFDECPVYETEHFICALVSPDDAEDLFAVYTDPVTLSHTNNDNCSGEWRLKSPDEIKNAWQEDYKQRQFVRWSVKDKTLNKAIGTIEIAPIPWGRWFFSDVPPIGILRLDLRSDYENKAAFTEIYALMGSELASDFAVKQVITKAPPDEPDRIAALTANGFTPYETEEYKYYYIKNIER